VAALLVTVFVVLNDGNNIPGEFAEVNSSVYQTAIGGLSKVQLSDGSQITLNTNSLIDVEFSASQRTIRLQRGELHIEVAHDPSRPLNVVVGSRVVQAVGTAFTVRIDNNQQIELLVIDGKVKVGVLTADAGEKNTGRLMNGFDNALLVSKGERFVLDDSNERLDRLEPEEVEIQLSWRDGNLIFHGEPLGDATAEISRYAPVEFVFLDEDLQNVRVAGLFKVGDVTGFLSSLEANFDIVYKRIDEQTIQLNSSAGGAN
jgi:transmembrane sensor